MNPELGPVVATSPKESYHISRAATTELYKKKAPRFMPGGLYEDIMKVEEIGRSD